MTLRRRPVASLIVLGTMTMLSMTALASPVSAEVIEGPCTGSATFAGPITVTESQPLSETTIVPEADTVQYIGKLNIDPPADLVPFAGGIDVALPPPLGGWTVVSWTGDTVEVADDGSYAYSVPSYVPRGTGGLRVTATHTQQGVTCIVAVTMALEGSPSTAAFIGAIAAIVFGIGTFGAGFRTDGRMMNGRPILGIISGFLFGVFAGISLFLWGMIPLDSVLLSILPFVGIAIGLAMAAWAPFGGSPGSAPAGAEQ